MKLRMILNSSEYNHTLDVSNCINLINRLITETYQQYLDLKDRKTTVAPPIPSLLNVKHGLPSEVGSISDNSESVSSMQSYVSRRSRRSNKVLL